MVGIGGIPAVFQFMMMLFLPETPRYLVKTGKVEKARNVLDRVYGRAQLLHNLVDGVLHSIEGEIEEEVKAKRRRSVRSAPSKYRTSYVARIFGGRWTELFQVPGNRRALIIACLLQGLQQLCGFVRSHHYHLVRILTNNTFGRIRSCTSLPLFSPS